ncbi:transmembrane protein [Rhynchospora pubera]|uniref:Transmembrane protein n=1 Tax=Rhynchospora pubera TaxID=906938 RepID=A0AAV8CQN9_9POAL|nr:transmembrane protein [Rhynchospora pubera]
MLVFTEGLDESAIQWVKGSEQEVHTPPKTWSPLATPTKADRKSLVDPVYGTTSTTYFSPKLNLHNKYNYLFGSAGEEEEEEESVGSISNTSPEGTGESEEETGPSESNGSSLCSVNGPVKEPVYMRVGGLVRGKSKENLRLDVAGVQDYTNDDYVPLNPPSAPPLPGSGNLLFPVAHDAETEDDNELLQDLETNEHMKTAYEFQPSDQHRNMAFSNLAPEEPAYRESVEQNDIHTSELAPQALAYTTSVHNAWESMVAYEACNRLCMNAYNRGCTEIAEFLQDECVVLRNAFGIQKFLLQPRGQHSYDARISYEKEEPINTKKKVIEKIEVEVKKIRIISQKSMLRNFSSLRSFYTRVGYMHVRNMTQLVKNQIEHIRRTSFSNAASSISSEERHECFLELQSDPKSSTKLYPGSGDCHCFFPDGQGDVLSVEVRCDDGTKLGSATIQVSSLSESNGQTVRWFPLYRDDYDCIGKIQISFNVSLLSDNSTYSKMAQGGPAVETLIYDVVLEAAMRAQNFHARNLHIKGPWSCLLTEFCTFYSVSDSYKTLRYLSHVMLVAIPTKDCLELIHELLLPVWNARSEQKLTQQEKAILADCEDQIKKLLRETFENYKSLDEFSLTGLADLFGSIVDSAPPALQPAVRLFGLLHDILSPAGQDLLRNYLQNAVEKRCKRHMLETEEFVSSNSDRLLTDTLIAKTAYAKMKNLCLILSKEIEADIKIYNQNVLPSCIDLPKIAANVYSTRLCNRVRNFLSACPPSRPFPHVQELLISTFDFERELASWNHLRSANGLVARDLFHEYVVNWIEDTRLHLLELCKTKILCTEAPAVSHVSPSVENIYEQIREGIKELEVVIKRWPHYLVPLEMAIADVERSIISALEKQYRESLTPIKESIQKTLEDNVKKIGNTLGRVFGPNQEREESSIYVVPAQLGTFLNTLKRMMDVLHCWVEEMMRPWAPLLTVSDQISPFGEHMNSISIVLKKKYRKYLQAVVKKLLSNTQNNRGTKLKRILEMTAESQSETEIGDRMRTLSLQVSQSIQNIHDVFPRAIFVEMVREFWDRLGQIVLKFLESRKEKGTLYRGSGVALKILEGWFKCEMQKYLGNALQEADLQPPRSVSEAKSILS